jgi:hypothetical protein
MTEKEKDIKIIEVIPDPIEEFELIETYVHFKDGDLHRMVNKKSDYLRDMLDLDKNNK